MRAVVAPLNHCERAYIEKLMQQYGRRSFRAKKCYANAQRLILADSEKRLRYWEGFMDDDIPHAWLTMGGKIVDVTMEAAERKLQRMGHAQRLSGTYSGVCINRPAVARHVLRTNEHGPVNVSRTLWAQ